MTAAPDLGDLGLLARALGLLDTDGGLVPGWFDRPGDYLASMLGAAGQRDALLDFLDGVLGGPEGSDAVSGVRRVPLVEHGAVLVSVHVDTATDPGEVGLGLAVDIDAPATAGSAGCRASLVVPIVGTPAADGAAPHAPTRLLLGEAGGVITASVAVLLPAGAGAGGDVRLDRLELAVTVPTDLSTSATESVSVSLALRGLALPGGGAPRDVVVEASSLDELDDALLQLVLGLVRAQAASLPAGNPLRGLARVLGLDDSAVPDFPLEALAARGAVALAEWLAAALGAPAARAAWLQGVADLLTGAVTGTGPTAAAELRIGGPAGPRVRIGVDVEPGTTGLPRVVPRIEVVLEGAAGVSLELLVRPVSIDLGSGAAVALPALSAHARVTGAAGPLLPVGPTPAGFPVGAGALVAGIALDTSRRPVVVLGAEAVTVGTTVHEFLDLSSPQALADAGGALVGSAVATLLARLGPAAEAIGQLLGVTDPVGVVLPRLDLARLVTDPLGAVGARWAAVLAAPPADVRVLLGVVRSLLAEPAAAAAAVTGDGTPAVPWRVPFAGTDPVSVALLAYTELAAGARTLVISVDARAAVADLGSGGAGARLTATGQIVGLDLTARRASFLGSVEADLALTGSAGGPLTLGLGGDTSVSAASAGLAVSWTPEGGLRVSPQLPGAALQADEHEIALPSGVLSSSGALALDASGWAAVEDVLGVLAQRTGVAWIAELARVVGWLPPVGGGSDAGSSTPRLRLEALVADPAGALGGWLADLADAALDDPALVLRALDTVAGVLGLPRLGSGHAGDPYELVLGAAEDVGAAALLALSGGSTPPFTEVTSVLRGWLPGDSGLDPVVLLDALVIDSSLDPALADLAGSLGTADADGTSGPVPGLTKLLDRWTSTDGVVAPPPNEAAALPAGAVVHALPDLTHAAPLADLDLTALPGFGAAPATVVYVAVQAPGVPAVLPSGLSADRALDLTAAGALPESAPVPVAATGAWAVRLGTRAACALPTGDPSGVLGQAARLRRVLAALAPAGDVVVVAHGGAGHAAARAAADLTAAGTPLRAVVTVGTPWSTLTLSTLDDGDANDALHLLAGLLPGGDLTAGEVDDDLGRAGQLISHWLALDALTDPLAELRLPPGLPTAAGVAIHVVVGVLSPEAGLRAVTACAAAGLATRARARATAAGDGITPGDAALAWQLGLTAEPGGLGLRLPAFRAQGGGVAVSGSVAVIGLPSLPAVSVDLDIRAVSGWLIGGPDPGRADHGERVTSLRRLSAELRTGEQATARLVLHGVSAFGVRRTRWVVDLSDVRAAAAAGVALSPPPAPAGPEVPLAALPTTLVPEVRALLGQVVGRLRQAAATDAALRPALDALRALGVLGTGALDVPGQPAGFDAASLEQLLLDPAAAVQACLGDPSRRAQLATALRAVCGDARAAAVAADTLRIPAGTAARVAVGAELDLATGALALIADAAAGPLPWHVTLGWSPGAPLRAQARVGADLSAAPAEGGTPGLAVLVGYDGAGVAGARLGAEARVRLPSRLDVLPLLPGAGLGAGALGGAAAGADLLRAATAAVPAALLQPVLAGIRGLAARESAAAAAALEALIDALGLLAPADPAGDRQVLLPAALLADPAGWLRTRPGGLVASVPALVDAARGLLAGVLPAAPAVPGTLPLHPGVALRAGSSGGGLALHLVLDGQALAGGADARLLPGGAVGLVLDAGGRALPDVAATLTLASIGAVRLTVGPNSSGEVAVRLELAPASGPAIVLVPAGPGLPAAAVAAAAVPALAAVLDALARPEPAAGSPPVGPAQTAARVVGAFGRALALGAGVPCVFDAGALRVFGTDPAAALATRAPALAGTVLAELANALGPLLGGTPAQRAAVVADGEVRVSIGGLTLGFDPGARRLRAAVTLTGLPGVDRVTAVAAATPLGLELLDVTVGPGSFAIPGPGGATVATLRPVARVRTSTTEPPTGVLVEVGLGVGATRQFAVRIRPGATPVVVPIAVESTSETSDPVQVALVAVAAVADVAGSVVLGLDAVRDGLDLPALGGASVRTLLKDVLLIADGTRLDPTFADDVLDAADDPAKLLARFGTLLRNVAAAGVAGVNVGGGLRVEVASTGDRLGVRLKLTAPLVLSDSDVTVELAPSGATDALWPRANPGLTLWLADLPPGGAITPAPGVLVEDLGLRIRKTSGPLLDAGIRLDGVALHLLGEAAPTSGGADVRFGVRLELLGLGVALAGAGGSGGGANPVASGLLRDAGGGGSPPRPAFSPALAVVVDGDGEAHVGLTAGPGAGPWFLVIQRGFGALYIEQVGLVVVVADDDLQKIGLVLDARVSLLGLTAAVDDLSLTYTVSGSSSPLDPSRWEVDLAGFAVTADMAGLTLAGGLRKFPVSAGGSEYLGMLLARFAAYGITVYGGYGLVGPPGDQFASLFLFGAVNGPIGGPPAFFVTGIGGGIGINRGFVVPNDLSQFGQYPLIKALDPGSRPGDPMTELENVRQYFPVQRGSFWFAGGVSFTSFALVDGVAVVAVQVGDGLEIALLGLARMALPRPQVALVSVELALVARFSSREGLLLVQASLTDNSWLLSEQVRLTGGFAFAAWFGGPNRGQFVLTLGGYHSAFHRDGYPVVPRLGFEWRFGPVMIRGGSFFALTSEAVMAGTDFEAHADFGPAWAHLRLGGEGIIFYDPFRFRIDVWAELSAGITIDFWIGSVTFSVSIGANVTSQGPPFYAIATVHVGPAEVSIEIGDRPSSPPAPLDWGQFVPKYLEEAAPGVAHVLTVVPGRGLAPAAGSAGNGSAPAPDGTDARPFRVQPEFSMTVTSTAPIARLTVGSGPMATLDTSGVVLGVAPMRRANVPPAVTLLLARSDGGIAPTRHPAPEPQRLGAFPLGVWGPPGDTDNPTVPRGDVVLGVDRVLLTSSADPRGRGPDVLYRQVEIDARKPLPLLRAAAARGSLVTRTGTTARLLEGVLPTDPALAGAAALATAASWVAQRSSPGAGAGWAADRAAPPRLGTLGEGLSRSAPTAAPAAVDPPEPVVPVTRPPEVRALVAGPGGDPEPEVAARLAAAGASTTVSAQLLAAFALAAGPQLGGAARTQPVVAVPPPRLAELREEVVPAIPARLVLAPAAAATTRQTVVASGAPPVTRSGRAGAEAVDRRGADTSAAARLRELGIALLDRGGRLGAGELALLDLPDSGRDIRADRPIVAVREGAVRVVVLDAGGEVVADQSLSSVAQQTEIEVATGAARVALLGRGGPEQAKADLELPSDGLSGWHADQTLPYAGLGCALATGAVIATPGRGARRGADRVRGGHVSAAELVEGESAVTTTFAGAVAAVAVVVEGGGAQDAALGLAGAERARDAAGVPLAPLVVAAGARGAVVTAVLPTGKGPVRLTVSTAASRRLVAVIGLAAGPLDDPKQPGATAACLATSLAEAGPEGLLGGPLPPGTGVAVLAWKEP